MPEKKIFSYPREFAKMSPLKQINKKKSEKTEITQTK